MTVEGWIADPILFKAANFTQSMLDRGETKKKALRVSSEYYNVSEYSIMLALKTLTKRLKCKLKRVFDFKLKDEVHSELGRGTPKQSKRRGKKGLGKKGETNFYSKPNLQSRARNFARFKSKLYPEPSS